MSYPDEAPIVAVHIASSDVHMGPPDRPAPVRKRRGLSVRSFTLTTADPVQQILPLNLNRCEGWVEALGNPATIYSSRADAQQAGNAGVTIAPTATATAAAGLQTVSATGAVATPAAGATLASIPAAQLPAGLWSVTVGQYISNGTPSAKNNIGLYSGAALLQTVMQPAQTLTQDNPSLQAPVQVYLDGTKTLSLQAIGIETVATYNVQLNATPVGSVAATTQPFPVHTTDPVWATAATFPTTISVLAIIEE